MTQVNELSTKWGGIVHQALERIIELEDDIRQLTETRASNEQLIKRLRRDLGQTELDLIAIQGKQAIDGETTE